MNNYWSALMSSLIDLKNHLGVPYYNPNKDDQSSAFMWPGGRDPAYAEDNSLIRLSSLCCIRRNTWWEDTIPLKSWLMRAIFEFKPIWTILWSSSSQTLGAYTRIYKYEWQIFEHAGIANTFFSHWQKICFGCSTSILSAQPSIPWDLRRGEKDEQNENFKKLSYTINTAYMRWSLLKASTHSWEWRIDGSLKSI